MADMGSWVSFADRFETICSTGWIATWDLLNQGSEEDSPCELIQKFEL